MSNWYLESGKEADVVLSTRIRLARNLKDIPFVNKMNKEQAVQVNNIVKQAIEKVGYGLRFICLKDLDDITKLSLVEKHILSPEFALSDDEIKSIAINDEENICIMINEEDHLRIQVLSEGLNLKSSLDLAIELDESLEKYLNYAYNNKYGFMTSCPTNVGTGLRCSIMVHLPALTKTGNITKVLNVVNGFDMNIRGIYGEGTNSKGNIYQISNKQSLGISETEIIKNLQVITDRVIEQERLARKILAKERINLEDIVYRAYGILSNAKKISSEECEKLLSDVRLGVDLGIISELTDLKVNKIDLFTKPANLQKMAGEKLDAYRRDIKRAEVIKQIINE